MMTVDSSGPSDERPSSEQATPTPPKSLDKIRSTLAAIHEHAPSGATIGPLAQGLKPEDRLLIASFYDRELRKRFQDVLLAHGISSSFRRGNGQDQVLVDMSDRHQAARLLDEHLAAYPDRPQGRGRRLVDFVLLGAVLGATVSACFVLEKSFARIQAQWGLVVASIIAFTGYGAVVGGLLGSLRDRLQRSRPQFTILDLLLLTALTALAALAWRALL